MKVAHSLYQLKSKVPLNGRQERQGALLQFAFPDGSCGYADCHPWTELGDAALQEQLALLAQGITTPLTARSLGFARLDAAARKAKKNLLDGLQLPLSHFLIPNLLSVRHEEVASAIQQGFTYFKVKLGSFLHEELKSLIELMTAFPSEKIKFRFDFNLKLKFDEAVFVYEKLSPFFQKIDYIEDPIPFNREKWSHLQRKGIASACDYQSFNAAALDDAARVLVIKPAIQDISQFIHLINQRLVVTSYLDHPVGQLCAAYAAAMLNRARDQENEVCGILSHHVYQTNEFSEQLETERPYLKRVEGTGFGFDSLLQNLNWIICT